MNKAMILLHFLDANFCYANRKMAETWRETISKFFKWRQLRAEFLKPVFHSCISPPLAKNYDNKIIFLGSFAAGESCEAPPVAENF